EPAAHPLCLLLRPREQPREQPSERPRRLRNVTGTSVGVLLLTALAGSAMAQTTGMFVPQPAGTGPAAFLSAAASGLARGVIVDVGINPSNQLPATWEYDGRQWQVRANLSTPNLPSRCAAYDVTNGRVVLVGGGPAGFETWDFDGALWRQRHLG